MTSSHHQPVPSGTEQHASPRVLRASPPAHRWECSCQSPPVLLATWTDAGQVKIKARDRYWHVSGCGVVQTVCPRCATEHQLDLGNLPAPPD